MNARSFAGRTAIACVAAAAVFGAGTVAVSAAPVDTSSASSAAAVAAKAKQKKHQKAAATKANKKTFKKLTAKLPSFLFKRNADGISGTIFGYKLTMTKDGGISIKKGKKTIQHLSGAQLAQDENLLSTVLSALKGGI